MGAKTTYFAQSSATATRATAVFTTAVAFANTPPNSTSVLYIGAVEVLGSAADEVECRLRDNTNATSYSVFVNRVTNLTSADCKILSSWTIITYGASPGSQSISVDVRTCAAATVLQRSNATLFGLVLEGNDQFVMGSDTFVSASGDVWSTVGTQLTVSVATSGQWIILSYAEASAESDGNAGSAQTTKFRMLVDGSATKHTSTLKNVRNPANYVYASPESFTAGSHTINMQAAWGGNEATGHTAGQSKIRRVRHAALEVSGFPRSYIQDGTAGSSGTSTTFTTIKSFTPDIIDNSKSHAVLAYFSPAVPSTGSDALTTYGRLLWNSENIAEVNFGASTQASVAGLTSNTFIIAIKATISGGSANNFSFQQKIEGAGPTYQLERSMIAVLQLDAASAAGGGPTTYNQNLTGVPVAIANITKQVGKKLEGQGTVVGDLKKTAGRKIEATTNAVAALGAGAAYRSALEAIAKANATLNARWIHPVSLSAVANAIADVKKRVGKLMEGSTRATADMKKQVGKKLESLTAAVVALGPHSQVNINLIASARAIASMTNVVVTASVVVASGQDYQIQLGSKMSLGNSVSYITSLGKGTTSDRDPNPT